MTKNELRELAERHAAEFCDEHQCLGINWSQVKQVSEGLDGALETLASTLDQIGRDFDERVSLRDLACALRGDRDCIAIVERNAQNY